MEPRKPTISDLERRFSIYAGDDADPDCYRIWCNGIERVVTRKPPETAIELYKRVCAVAREMLRTVNNLGVFAHIYAGIVPTEADVFERAGEPIFRALRWEMSNGETSLDRVNAAIRLAEICGFMPPEVRRVELIFR